MLNIRSDIGESKGGYTQHAHTYWLRRECQHGLYFLSRTDKAAHLDGYEETNRRSFLLIL